jgi:hypothetical protein
MAFDLGLDPVPDRFDYFVHWQRRQRHAPELPRPATVS